MVVTRKPPAPPIATRTSAQPIPRVKGKLPQTIPDAPNLTDDTLRAFPPDAEEGEDPLDPSSKKGKAKWKGKSKKEKNKNRKSVKQWTFTDLLTRIFLVWFTIYTLSVCPDDQSLKKPVCRGLYTFRKLLIEPYLIPPLQQALHHPSIAPYVERAKPAVNFAVDHATPVALRTRQEFNQRVVPQWKKRVIPQWKKHVVPRWQKHVGPYVTLIQHHAEPYVMRLQEYGRWAEPYARATFVQLQEWQHRARPYVILAAHKTYDGYQKVKPYAIPVIHKIQELLLQLWQFLIQQRREFVDPQVWKIWERVKELSRGDIEPLADIPNAFTSTLSRVSAAASPAISSALHPSPSLVPKASEAVIGSASSVLPLVIPESGNLPSLAPTITTDPVATLKSYSTAIPSSVLSAASSMASSIVSSVVSVAQESVSPMSTRVVSSMFNLGNTASSTYSSISSAAQDTTLPASASIITASASPAIPTISPVANSDDDLDLDQFYADLGLDEELFESSTIVPTAEPTTATPESEEEKAEKLRLKQEETARKRADISRRHLEWEKLLEERIEENHKTLRRNLVTLRKTAVTELSESEKIRGEIESLVEEAEKYLKGADKYMTSLKRESKGDEEKRTLWERVVEKVDAKFSQRLSQTEAVVNEWYLNVLEKEIYEVKRLAAQVKDIADRAQADIGLDYAWLDDVTYDDWQRYHDLDRRSENFTAQAYAVQNGTDPSPPSDPVLAAIEDLQAEVQDVVVGFETRLRRIKRNGQRAFGASNTELDVDADLSSGSGPSDDTVTTLPIEDEPSPANIPSIIIGRNKEEVVSALDRAADQEAQAPLSPGDENQQPEQVIESLAQEAVAETHPTASPSHDEL